MVELTRYAIAISAAWYPHFKGTDLGVITNYQGRIGNYSVTHFQFLCESVKKLLLY
jgi:hypothetical protein